jgi:hypothetical protein
VKDELVGSEAISMSSRYQRRVTSAGEEGWRERSLGMALSSQRSLEAGGVPGEEAKTEKAMWRQLEPALTLLNDGFAAPVRLVCTLGTEMDKY